MKLLNGPNWWHADGGHEQLCPTLDNNVKKFAQIALCIVILGEGVSVDVHILVFCTCIRFPRAAANLRK
jgi:hypothetical protein